MRATGWAGLGWRRNLRRAAIPVVLLASLTACRSLVLSSGTLGASMHVHATTGGTLTTSELAARVYTSSPADLAPLQAFLRAGGLGTHADIQRNNGRVWVTTNASGATFAAYTRSDQLSHSALAVAGSHLIDEVQPLSIFNLDEETASICMDPALGSIVRTATASTDCRQFHELNAAYIYDLIGDVMLVDTVPGAATVAWVPGDATVCEAGDCEIAGAPTLAITFRLDLTVNQGQPFTRWVHLHGVGFTTYRIQPNVCARGACDRDARGPSSSAATRSSATTRACPTSESMSACIRSRPSCSTFRPMETARSRVPWPASRPGSRSRW